MQSRGCILIYRVCTNTIQRVYTYKLEGYTYNPEGVY